MSLSDEDKYLLRTSWTTITALGLQAVGLQIFVRLFTDHPRVIPLFKNIVPSNVTVSYESLESNYEMASHALNVAEALNEIIVLIDDRKAFAEYMKTIADVHRDKNVVSSHFNALGGVVLNVIRSILGSDATDDVMAAWMKVYGTIQETILNIM